MSPPLGLAEYMERVFLPEFRPGGQIQDIQPDPETAEKNALVAQETYSKGNLEQRKKGQPGNWRIHNSEAGTVTLKIVSGNIPRQEWLFATKIGASNGAGLYSSGATVGSFWAPEGPLEKYESFSSTLRASTRINPAWMKAVADFGQQLLNEDWKGKQIFIAENQKHINRMKQQAAQSAKIYQNSQIAKDTILEDQHKAYMKDSAEKDKINSKTINSIKEVETYVNPITQETFEMSNQYDQAWQNGIGETVGTYGLDDPNQNNLLNDQTWTKTNKYPY